MRRSEDTHRKQLYVISTLFLEDIEAFESLAREAGFTCTFSDDQYQFESVNEILEYKGSNIKELHALFTQNNLNEEIHVMFTYKSAAISAYGNSNELKALWIDLNSILSKHKMRSPMLHNPGFAGGMAVGASVGFGIAAQSVQRFTIYEFAFLGIFALVFIYSLYKWKSHPAIFLDRKHRRSTFWSRNNDKVIMLIIGALIGLFVKMLYDHFMK